jgi:hypothetical protein
VDDAPTKTTRVPWSRVDLAVLLIPAILKGTLHLLTHRGFGFVSDEFYYIACSNRLDWGYVDHPQLSILLLRIDLWLLGDSLEFQFAESGCGCDFVAHSCNAKATARRPSLP